MHVPVLELPMLAVSIPVLHSVYDQSGKIDNIIHKLIKLGNSTIVMIFTEITIILYQQ